MENVKKKEIVKEYRTPKAKVVEVEFQKAILTGSETVEVDPITPGDPDAD